MHVAEPIKINCDDWSNSREVRIEIKNQLFHAINSQLTFLIFLCLWGKFQASAFYRRIQSVVM